MSLRALAKQSLWYYAAVQRKLERAIIINVIPPDKDKTEAMAEFDELIRLIETYGGMVILKIIQKRSRPSARTFVGSGKAHELASLVRELKADVVVVNGFLKPNQSNNLVNIIPCEVLDRFEMILKIFEKHAISPEAKLQLQIAQHKYEFPKLFGRGAVLSQQAAGIGGAAAVGRRAARGPGEKILEVKRRHLRRQIQMLEEKLAHFQRVRSLQRERRQRNNFVTIALVGYTNSGKSSILNALTKKQNVLVEDKLFSTLDTRLAELYLSDQSHCGARTRYERDMRAPPHTLSHAKILLADTIGFIQNLPPLLFSSFLATLEEVKQADLLLHIIDISDPDALKKIDAVEDVLTQMGCVAKPRIYVFNKIDVCRAADIPVFENKFKEFSPVFVSALKRENLEGLRNAIWKYFEIKIRSPAPVV